jgi:hypothetical protein
LFPLLASDLLCTSFRTISDGDWVVDGKADDEESCDDDASMREDAVVDGRSGVEEEKVGPCEGEDEMHAFESMQNCFVQPEQLSTVRMVTFFDLIRNYFKLLYGFEEMVLKRREREKRERRQREE